MNAEERLKIIKEMLEINAEQIANREKVLSLSRKLAEDNSNNKLRMEIKNLELENMNLSNRSKALTSKL